MSERSSAEGSSFPERGTRNDQTRLGGADAVEKTTYVTGRGTSPEAIKPEGRPAATTPSSGRTPLLWVVIVLVALVVIGYGAGFFR